MSKVIKFYYSKPVYNGKIINNPINDNTAIYKINPGKRYTIATVYDDDSKTIKFGLAICMPQDNFNKEIGRKISTNNALNNPFYVINDFDGRRNNYIDKVMEIIKNKEHYLLKKEYPQMFNPDYII